MADLEDNKNDVLDTLNFLDLNEELIDVKIEAVMKKDVSNRQLRILLCLVKYKHMISMQEDTDCDNETIVNFLLRQLMINNTEDKLNQLLKLLSLSLELNKENVLYKIEHILQQVLSELTLNRKSFTSEDVNQNMHYLKIIDCLCKTCIKNSLQPNNIFIKNEMFSLLSCQEKTVNLHLFSNTIPNIIECFNEYGILNDIYDKVAESDSLHFNNVLSLCSLSNYYFPTEKYKAKIQSSIVKDVKFWKKIQEGLFGIDDSTRKCCNYLVKRVIDYVLQNNVNIAVLDNESNIPYFIYDNEDRSSFKSTWHDLFVIIESIEEKQFNLVDSALDLLPNITILHPSWYHYILKRTLVHESNGVMRKSLTIALKYDNQYHLFFYNHLLIAMNKIFLYENFFKPQNKLMSLFVLFLSKGKNFEFVIRNLKDESLSPIPRFFMVYMIMKASQNIKINNTYQDISDAIFGENGFKFNNWFIENGTQCCLLNFYIKNKSLTPRLNDFAIIFAKFSPNILCRHSKVWRDTSDVIKNTFITCDSRSILNEITSLHDGKNMRLIIKMLVMFIDASLIKIDDFITLTNSKIAELKDCDKRVYANAQRNEFDECFLFIVNCLIEIKSNVKDDYLYDTFVSNLSDRCYSIISYLIMKLNNVSINEYYIMCDISHGFKELMKDDRISLQIYLNVSPITAIMAAIMNMSNKDHIQKCFSVKLLSEMTMFIHKSDYFDQIKSMEIINSHYNIIGAYLFLKTDDSDGIYQLKGNVMSCYNEAICKILHCYYSKKINWDNSEILGFEGNVANFLERGGCLLWTIKLLIILVPKLMVENLWDKIRSLLNRAWKEILQVKKNEQFRKCIDKFVKVLFNKAVLDNNGMTNIIEDCSMKILELGETAPFSIYLMMRQIRLHYKSYNMRPLLNVLFESLTFGNVLRKDQRIEYDICAFMESDKDIFSSNDLLEGNLNRLDQIRVIGLEIFINKNSDLQIEMMHMLMNKINSICKPKQRYHANSLNHRLLLRALQCMLLNYKLTKCTEDIFQIIEWCVSLLNNQPHHHSIKILLEWLIVLHLFKLNLSLEEAIRTFRMDQMPQMSQFMIIYLFVKRQIYWQKFNDVKTESLLKNIDFAVEMYLPFTMGQIFNIRLHAQYLIVQLFEALEHHESIKKYEIFNKIISANFEMCSEEKNLKKIRDDFYINKFDVIENLNVESIFLHIPRLTGVVKDEWVGDVKFLDGLISEKKITHEFDLSNLSISVMHSNENYIDDSVQLNNSGSIQKKFVPWKHMLADIGINLKETEIKDDKSNLIVVASLIDRIPNLGGLCRTCEVFGVKQYVINSLKLIQDVQFQKLSVSSERWVDIAEVQPGQNLRHYLMDMKRKGYSIIGAEQSSSSVLLNKFSFPSNSLLVLGHEKEGISPDLLNVLDYCVEIPQQGLVRSLNVHVTASIFIWEYARQHAK